MRGGRWEGWYADGEGDRENERAGAGRFDSWFPRGLSLSRNRGQSRGDRGKFRRNLPVPARSFSGCSFARPLSHPPIRRGVMADGCEDNCRSEEFSRVKRRGRLAEM